MIRLLGICVALLGIAGLVFGIIFVVMAGSTRTEVFDGLKDEGFPMFGPSEAYPYLGLTAEAVANGDIIDTADDLEAAADALDGARYDMVTPPAGVAGFQILFGPSTIQTINPADGSVISLEDALILDGYTKGIDTLQLHEYSALLGFSGVLAASQMGLGMASMMQIIGIVAILLGVALMVTGLVITVKVGSE